MKVVAIGDLHDSPNIRDKSRFRWIAKHIKKVKPDVVVQIGDIITLDSCTHYISDDTYTARIEKPTFMKEMQSFDEALEEFHYVLKGENQDFHMCGLLFNFCFDVFDSVSSCQVA